MAVVATAAATAAGGTMGRAALSTALLVACCVWVELEPIGVNVRVWCRFQTHVSMTKQPRGRKQSPGDRARACHKAERLDRQAVLGDAYVPRVRWAVSEEASSQSFGFSFGLGKGCGLIGLNSGRSNRALIRPTRRMNRIELWVSIQPGPTSLLVEGPCFPATMDAG